MHEKCMHENSIYENSMHENSIQKCQADYSGEREVKFE